MTTRPAEKPATVPVVPTGAIPAETPQRAAESLYRHHPSQVDTRPHRLRMPRRVHNQFGTLSTTERGAVVTVALTPPVRRERDHTCTRVYARLKRELAARLDRSCSRLNAARSELVIAALETYLDFLDVEAP